jgi:DNA repair photolyase
MIISASRRTDIPAFYSDWFMNRVRDGYFYRVNPFNSNQVSGFSLKAEDVDAICFWTKNPAPLMHYLGELDSRGLNYYFQFTLNPYGKAFEPNLPPIEERIATFRELAGRIGPDRVVWRYDPIILTNITPVSWHAEQAEQIANQLKDSTRRLVFSFYDFYGKGQGRLNHALKGTGIILKDITASDQATELNALVHGFKEIAKAHNLRIFSCSEDKTLMAAVGIEQGACIDGTLIKELFGGNPSEKTDGNQRNSCNCVESVDMGIYNTCLFRCNYCYANFNEGMIESNRQKHYPDSPSLVGMYQEEIEIQSSLKKGKKIGGNKKMSDNGQLSLFQTMP